LGAHLDHRPVRMAQVDRDRQRAIAADTPGVREHPPGDLLEPQPVANNLDLGSGDHLEAVVAERRGHGAQQGSQAHGADDEAEMPLGNRLGVERVAGDAFQVRHLLVDDLERRVALVAVELAATHGLHPAPDDAERGAQLVGDQDEDPVPRLVTVHRMPELPEVEAYRALAEARALNRPVADVRAPDEWYLKEATDLPALCAALTGRRLVRARRRGKLLLLDIEPGDASHEVLGLRFGMSGRLVVDGLAGVGELLYTTTRVNDAYERFALRFADGGELVIHDPRRLGGVILDPAEDRLGPDARGITLAELRTVLGTGAAPLKARLMDQARLAGVGNLLADEILWRAGLSPLRPAGRLTPAELRRLRHHLVAAVERAIAAGGSHTGALMVARRPGGRCPRDGAALRRDQVGGRTTWWCPEHQH
jgi:formamidopyrimidine-DNA glycosylase